MNEDERSGVLVSAIAVGGLGLFAVLTIPLWPGPAQAWLGPLKDWLPAQPAVETCTETVQGPMDAWSDNEVKTALTQCAQGLALVTADVAPLAPIRCGDRGTPAPVLVRSIGGGTDKVSFDPPLMLYCAMVVGLDRWLTESIQAAAPSG